MIKSAVGARSRAAPSVLRLVLVAVVTLLLWGAVGIPRAAAHAELLDTVPADGEVLPAAPHQLELIFSEPVRVPDGGVRWFAPDGSTVTVDASVRDHRVLVDLPPSPTEGRHTLTYRVVSADGHPVGGAVSYGVGDLSGTAGGAAGHGETPDSTGTDLLVAGSAALQYLGLVLLVGLVTFERARRGSGMIDPRLFGRLLRGAWLTALVGAVLQVPAIALRAVGAEAWRLVRPGDWWPAVSASTVLAAGVLAVAGALTVRLANGGGRAERCSGWGSRGVLAAAGLTGAAPVLVGHSQTMTPRWLGMLADLVHLGAASVWVGGLLGLAVLLRHSRATDPVRLAEVVARFSVLALGSVVALGVTGVTMAALILPDWAALLGTGYGRTLLVKISVVLAVVVLAGWNRFRLVPAVRARPGEREGWFRLRAVLRREFALVLAVVAITGVLSAGSPVHDQHPDGGRPGSVRMAAESQGLAIDGVVTPARSGPNTLDFALTHRGEPFDGEEVTVRATLPEQELGPIEVVPEIDPGSGRYRAELTLPAAGEWQLEFAARTSTYEQPIVVVTVPIS